MHFDVYWGHELVSKFDVNYKTQRVYNLENFTKVNIKLPFSVNKTPSWADYEWFLRDRVFPEERDNCKEELWKLGLDYWDPLSIIKVTKGRMAEDLMWMEVS